MGNSKTNLHESVLDVNVELALDSLIAAWEDTVPGISLNSRKKIVDELTDDVVDAVDKANSKAKNISIEYTVPIGTHVKLMAQNGKTFDLKTTQFNIFDSSDIVSMSDDSIVFSKGSAMIAVPRSKIEKSVQESKMKITVRQFKKLIRESMSETSSQMKVAHTSADWEDRWLVIDGTWYGLFKIAASRVPNGENLDYDDLEPEAQKVTKELLNSHGITHVINDDDTDDKMNPAGKPLPVEDFLKDSDFFYSE